MVAVTQLRGLGLHEQTVPVHSRPEAIPRSLQRDAGPQWRLLRDTMVAYWADQLGS